MWVVYTGWVRSSGARVSVRLVEVMLYLQSTRLDACCYIPVHATTGLRKAQANTVFVDESYAHWDVLELRS